MTAHDGFPMHDLVTYNNKHNEANLEATGTAPTTTGPGTAGSKVPPRIARS